MILTTNWNYLNDGFSISIKLTNRIFLSFWEFLEIWLSIIIKKQLFIIKNVFE